MATVYENRYTKARALMEKNGGPSSFAKRLGVTKQYISHVLSESAARKNIGGNFARKVEQEFSLPIGYLDVQDTRSLSSEHTVVIPMLNVSGSMGGGALIPWHEEVIHEIRIQKQWLSHNVNVTSFDGLRVIAAKGDSMEPTFSDGAMLIVDTSVSAIKLEAVYVIGFDDQLYIKRIQRNLDGSCVVKSDNALYTDQIVDKDNRERMIVYGRVLIAWNPKKL